MAFLAPFIPAILGGIASAVVGSLLSDKPKAPTPTATPLAPTMDSSLIAKTQQASAAAQQARSGRVSTILSGTSPTDKGTLGG